METCVIINSVKSCWGGEWLVGRDRGILSTEFHSAEQSYIQYTPLKTCMCWGEGVCVCEREREREKAIYMYIPASPYETY